MGSLPSRRVVAWSVLIALILAMTTGIVACSGDDGGTSSGDQDADDSAASPAADAAEEPSYSSWVVYINDEDSYQEGGITYTIALNLTATNPSADPAGTYTGTATASTSSVGTYEGMELNASAIANSTQLTFDLQSDLSGGGELGSLTDQELGEYGGSGTIAMQAAGSGTFGPAGGSFGNTSGQEILFTVSGGQVQMTISIDGHVYTFNGVLQGQEAAE